MRKSNLVTASFFMVLIFAAAIFMVLRDKPLENFGEKRSEASQTPIKIEVMAAAESPSVETISETENIVSGEVEASVENPPIPPGNALFIGDSRTVGLWEYGNLEGADFFANDGMSVYNIYKKLLSVPSVGKVTLTELLDNRQYAKIYIMLGINELGYNLDKTAAKYKELVALIQEKQPEACLILQANLHVSKKRSERDTVINNGAINCINAKIAEMADNQEIFYLDANVLFDDGNGNLDAEKTGDEAHPYGKYYAGWSDWILQQTVGKG